MPFKIKLVASPPVGPTAVFVKVNPSRQKGFVGKGGPSYQEPEAPCLLPEARLAEGGSVLLQTAVSVAAADLGTAPWAGRCMICQMGTVRRYYGSRRRRGTDRAYAVALAEDPRKHERLGRNAWRYARCQLDKGRILSEFQNELRELVKS